MFHEDLVEVKNMEDKKVRGSIINGFIKYIKRTWGEKGMDGIEDELNMDVTSFNDRKWYDHEIHSKIHRWIVENHGEGHLERAGSYTVQNMGILSYLIKFTSPDKMLKKAPKSYRDAFSYGDVEIKVEEKKAYVKMKGVALDEYTCLAWRGVFEGVLEATNSKGTIKEWDAEEKGDKDCYFIAEWE